MEIEQVEVPLKSKKDLGLHLIWVENSEAQKI